MHTSVFVQEPKPGLNAFVCEGKQMASFPIRQKFPPGAAGNPQGGAGNQPPGAPAAPAAPSAPPTGGMHPSCAICSAMPAQTLSFAAFL